MSDDEDEPELKDAQEAREASANAPEGEREAAKQAVQEEVKVVPLWCNLKLPKQPVSKTAHAASQTRFSVGYVPLPTWLGTTLGKRRMDEEAKYRKAEWQQTALVYDAYVSLAIVTVPIEEKDVARLLAAEKAELLAAHGQGDCDPAAAKPRSYAVTVLIPHAPSCADRACLLDCMAMLSRARAEGVPAIQNARMAVLANQDALFYAENTGRRAIHLKSGGANQTQVVLTYMAEENGKLVRKCEYVHLKDGKRSQVVFKSLVVAIATAFTRAGLAMPASLAFSSDVSSELIDGAYKKGMQEVNNEFWSSLCAIAPPPALDFKLHFGPTGNIEHRIFLRIARVDQEITDMDAYFGMLLYEKNKASELFDYAVAAMQEERAKVNQGNYAICGLRAPVTTKERASRPHVLTVKATHASFRNRISCFGLKGAPGYQVSEYDHAVMPKLEFALQPFNEVFTNMKWVFPCLQEDTDSLDDKLALAQSQLAMDAFRAYGEITDLDEEARGVDLSPPPPKDSVFKAKKLKGKACKEGAVIAQMTGVPLGGAFRLGDVLERVEKTKQSMPVMRAFLTSCVSRLGRNAPMIDALKLCTKLEETHASEVKQLRDRVVQLENDLLQEQTATKRAEAAASAVVADIAPCSLDAMSFCLEGMKRRAAAGTPIKLPITNGRAHGIANVLCKAHGTPTEHSALAATAEAHWEACKDMSACAAAAYIGQKVYGCPLYVVFVREGNEAVDFLKATQPAGQLEKVSPMHMYDAPKRDNPVLMLKYVEEHKKLYALVPSE